MDTKITQIEDLITRYKQLKAHLSNFEPKNTEHRQLVIKAIEIYIKKYIPPALHLIATDEEGNKLISINQVVGEQITGLGLNLLFDSKRQDLTRPSNEELNEVLEYAGREPTPQLRDDFWTAWLLRESKSCLKALINFLEEPLIPTKNKQIKPSVLRQEIQQLEKLLELPTFGITYSLESLINWEKEALARWTEDPKYFITIES